jgi:NAD(P)H-flavin reductase
LKRRRTLAPCGRRLAKVTRREIVGAYVVISAADATGPANPRPGQFYMLSTEQRWGGGEGGRPYLPRAFSFARALKMTDGGVELQFLLERVGPGTDRLASLQPGEGMWITGPLGMGFDPGAETRALLVGGGIGVAPLLGIADSIKYAAALLGFRTGQHAAAARLFPSGPQVVTDDGSVGDQALVTELLHRELVKDTKATVYACGPPAMLEGVRALCEEREVPAQLAMESGMACGYGACFGCVVPTKSGYVRLCVDGPVVDAAELETAVVTGSGH